MPIVHSTIVADSPQADGRRWVREEHTDDAGAVQYVDYLAEADDEPKERLADRAKQLDQADEARQLAADAERLKDKEQAAAILKLADDDVKAVLRLDNVKDVAAAKAMLAEVAK